MAAKILHSLTDDNPDLQKQIGCLTGVFPVLDSHQMVSGRRFSGSQHFGYSTPERKSTSSYQRPHTEKYPNKIVQDKNRASTESPQEDSMSRSSLGCSNNKTHQEPDQIMFTETPLRDSLTHHSVDLGDLVKDSMYRESHAKFQDSSWCYNEPREFLRSKSYQYRDGPDLPVPKDCHRLSYDGWETDRLCFQSRDCSRKVDQGPVQSRQPSVVARLMGLDPLPDFSSAQLNKSGFRANQNAHDLIGQIKMHNSDLKPIPRFPVEPAPWKQRAASGPVSCAMKSPSVYSEVDKRLKNLEFTESGKDLRALKQILEAMQLIEAQKERERTRPVSVQNERFSDRQKRMESNNFRAYKPSIVILKPTKVVKRLSGPVNEFPSGDRKIFRNIIHKGTVDQTEVKGGGRHTRSTPGLTKQLTKENVTNSGKRLVSVIPKRPESERLSRPPTAPVVSGKVRKQMVKQGSELSSSGRRSNYGQQRQVKGESKKLSPRKSQLSHEVVNISEFYEEVDHIQSPISIQEKSTIFDPEYPSPVSVLDVGVYTDGSPSPVKHKLKTLRDDDPDDITPDTLSSGVTSEIRRKKLQDIEHLVQKLSRLNLDRHNEPHTDYIASIFENTKPDDTYISEILLASGLLLRDLGSNLTTFQFHSSGHPINPELFFVLEQTKFNSLTKQVKKEKIHRKLVFDAVNEILARKLGSSVPLQKSFKFVKKTFNAQKLMRDLCLEVEQLQVEYKKGDVSLEEEDDELKSVLWEEVLNRAESWTDYDGEIPVITLEVERLIFKELVNEVVLGEAADGRRVKAGRHCRQLFSR